MWRKGGSGSALLTDADEYQALMPLAMLLVPRPGEFRARLTWMGLPSLYLLRARETAPRIAYVSLPPEWLFVIFPTSRSSMLVCNGAQLRWGDLILHSQGERFHQRTTLTAEWGALALTPESLHSYGTTLVGRSIAPPLFSQLLRPLPTDQRRLLRVYREALRIAETRLKHIEHPEVTRALEQDLIWALIMCLSAAKPHSIPLATRRCAQMLVEFEETLISRPEWAPDISQIRAAMGVSERVLRTCTSNLLGMDADRYLTLRRLECVRQALLNANSTGETRAQIVLRYGFADTDAFMTAYRDAFGDLPRQPPHRPLDR
jgi:AraC-like DNA-binding protein